MYRLALHISRLVGSGRTGLTVTSCNVDFDSLMCKKSSLYLIRGPRRIQSGIIIQCHVNYENFNMYQLKNWCRLNVILGYYYSIKPFKICNI